MISKFWGGILLIVGTSVGGGMLALPIANAAPGLIPSSVALVMCWSLMTLGAFLLLEANLYFPPGSNMLSMAYQTLGLPGLVITWFTYLLLLYVLLAAYISGGADVLQGILNLVAIDLNDWQSACLFTLSFGFIVFGGMHQVDWANRLLMFFKLAIYILLVSFVAPYIELKHWEQHDMSALPQTLMILVTSFGFAIIVPNLRTYFQDDLIKLKKVIIIGSIIPLICYFAWDGVIMGTLPAHGEEGIIALVNHPHPTSRLAYLLGNKTHHYLIAQFFRTFTSICMLTAFLGVALCLKSFLSDGLKLNEYGIQRYLVALLTFFPPLGLVLFFPNVYLRALQYAGMLCVVLLMALPAVMTLVGRHYFQSTFRVPGGIWPPIILLFCAISLLFVNH